MDNNPTPPATVAANPRQQIIERLKTANNVLVTVSNNPSVDQLAACIGLTLMLNKLGKHGTAVFSGSVPSTIEFLKPEATLEKNTDSLRDFIIALDKSKADKLRYKVEDKIVKIFITPYKTSLSEKDLDFSYGDFNVDLVVALGVHRQQDLDQAITAQGRILHDATIASINNSANGNLGNINWVDTVSSSLSELIAGLDGEVGKATLDSQISTALLTGIVAETKRFSNAKTTSQTMSISAKLMSAGANQQLVVSKLEPPAPPPPPVATNPQKPDSTPKTQPPKGPTAVAQKPAKKPDDGTLKINHDENQPQASMLGAQDDAKNQIEIDTEGNLHALDETPPELQPPVSPPGPVTGDNPPPTVTGSGTPMITEPPKNGGQLTGSFEPEDLEPTDSLSLPNVAPPQPNGLNNLPNHQIMGGQAPAAPDVIQAPAFLPLATEPPAVAPQISKVTLNNDSAANERGLNTMDMPAPSSVPGQPNYNEDQPSGLASTGQAPPPVPPPPLPSIF